MTITYPYPLPYFADLLKIKASVFDVQRNDEMSGTGDGRVIAAEMAPPLWIGEITLAFMLHDAAKDINSRLRRLNGPIQSLLMYDPKCKYPQWDPTGSKLGAAAVKVNAVGANRDTLRLSALPSGYRLTNGDRLEVLSPTGRRSYLEVSESTIADGTGITPEFSVFPNVPSWMAANLDVKLIKPAMRCFIMPNTYKPGTATIEGVDGITFKVVERK